MKKKLFSRGFVTSVACSRGTIFKRPIKEYMEQKHRVSIFGITVCLNTHKDHPLYQKLTCSPDGYFVKDGKLVLVEFKCPFKRAIARKSPPKQYVEQLQANLALRGDNVKSGLFVDAFFRICSFKQLLRGVEYNKDRNNSYYLPSVTSPLAWGVCYVYRCLTCRDEGRKPFLLIWVTVK